MSAERPISPLAVPIGTWQNAGQLPDSGCPLTISAPRTNELQAVAAAAIGSTAVGFVPFFISGLQQAGTDTVSALALRFTVALLVLVPLAVWQTGGLGAEWRRGGRWLFLNGLILGTFQVYCYFKAVETLATSIVVTIFYVYPVIAIALDRFMFGLEVRRTTLLAVAIVIAGVALASVPGFAGAALDPTGLFFAALAPFGYAAYIAAAYPITKRVAPLASAVFIYGAYTVAFGAWALARGLRLPSEPGLWLNVLYIGTLGGAMQVASFAYALPRLSSSGYAIIVCLEFVTVVIAGVLLLGEKLLPVQWVGVGLVLGGILLERLSRAAAARRQPSRTLAVDSD